MKTYKIELSGKGKEIFKGGNIEVLKKMLFSFKAENQRKAEKYFYLKLCEILGSASEWYFNVVEVKDG